MRKFLMMTVVVGATALGFGAGTEAEAAPVVGAFAAPLSVQSEAQVQTVQYRGQRHRRFRRHYRHGPYRR